jgi:general secretion pathway protein C
MNKRHITYLNILLGAALMLIILFFIKDTLSSYQIDMDKNSSFPKTNISTDQRRLLIEEYSPILNNNPFGFAGGKIRPLKTSSTSSAQQVNTDITLIGTVTGPKKLSYAVFHDTSGIQEVFKVGESVFGLGTLSRVKTDRIIIVHEEGSLELLLEDVGEDKISKTAYHSSSLTSGFARKIGKGTYIVDQRKVQQAIENPTQIMTDARLTPNVRNGIKEGFILSEVKRNGIYYSLGLRNGDVLLRINEYDISNPETALQAFTALRGLDRIQIDLVRAGSKMTMTYQIK